jgi:hypothetical protein
MTAPRSTHWTDGKPWTSAAARHGEAAPQAQLNLNFPGNG